MALRRRVHNGTELTNSNTTMLTFSVGLAEGGAILRSISLANRASTRRLITIFFVPSGGSTDDNNCIFNDYVEANASIIIGGPWFGDSSAFVVGLADTATSAVGARVSAVEDVA